MGRDVRHRDHRRALVELRLNARDRGRLTVLVVLHQHDPDPDPFPQLQVGENWWRIPRLER